MNLLSTLVWLVLSNLLIALIFSREHLKVQRGWRRIYLSYSRLRWYCCGKPSCRALVGWPHRQEQIRAELAGDVCTQLSLHLFEEEVRAR